MGVWAAVLVAIVSVARARLDARIGHDRDGVGGPGIARDGMIRFDPVVQIGGPPAADLAAIVPVAGREIVGRHAQPHLHRRGHSIGVEPLSPTVDDVHGKTAGAGTVVSVLLYFGGCSTLKTKTKK